MEKRLKRALRVIKQGIVTCKEVGCMVDGVSGLPSIIYIRTLDLRGYLDLALKNRIRAKLGHSSLPIEISGNWSRKTRNFDLTEWYRVKELRQHFCLGVPWNQIESVTKKRYLLDRGYIVSDAHSHEELDLRLNSHDLLFDKIKNNEGLSSDWEHLVQLNISESGGLYWGPDGQHRIAMAVILGIEFIPMKLSYVHPEGKWMLDHLLPDSEQEQNE
ncbi:hypothetical protein Q427_11920 [Halomonas sp. BC04]|nr:hypothetical protein Q427_11920 [Halomonas sp. BC04]